MEKKIINPATAPLTTELLFLDGPPMIPVPDLVWLHPTPHHPEPCTAPSTEKVLRDPNPFTMFQPTLLSLSKH